MTTPVLRLSSITALVWLAAQGTAAACPVCVGVSDSPLASGMNAGVLVLLAVTVGVLGGIFLVGRRVMRAASRHAAGTASTAFDAPSGQRRAPNTEAPLEANPC